jgi:hypothetical protein
MYKFIELNPDQIDEQKFYDFDTKTVYTTKEWLRFIERTHLNVKVKVLEVYEHDQFVGYFTGAVVTIAKLFRILGSPFNGWNTPCMGFDLYDPHKAINILPHVVRYFQTRYHCIYAQIYNMYFVKEELAQHGFKVQRSNGFQTDLSLSEQEIFAKFNRGTKANVKRFERMGCRVEEDYSQEFVDIYWDQLVDIFGKQGLTPSYDKKRVEVMIDELRKKERILCIKAVTPEGLCPATLIQVGYGYLTTTVGCPSFLKYRNEYRPNEALIWYAIKHWKGKEAKIFDYGGGGEYKKKYGGAAIEYHTSYFSRMPGLFMFKELANKAYWRLNSLHSRKACENGEGQ